MVHIVPFRKYQYPPATHIVPLSTSNHLCIQTIKQSIEKSRYLKDYHLYPPTWKTSEYSFFVFNLEKFSIVHVNRADGGSSTGGPSTVLAVSAVATANNKKCKFKRKSQNPQSPQ